MVSFGRPPTRAVDHRCPPGRRGGAGRTPGRARDARPGRRLGSDPGRRPGAWPVPFRPPAGAAGGSMAAPGPRRPRDGQDDGGPRTARSTRPWAASRPTSWSRTRGSSTSRRARSARGRRRRRRGPDRRHRRGLPGAGEIDGRGKVVVPGFVDAHVHVESSLVTARRVRPAASSPAAPRPRSATPTRSRTCSGSPGSATSSTARRHLAMDLRVQLSSCVPATAPRDLRRALSAADLARAPRPPGGPRARRDDELPRRPRQGPGGAREARRSSTGGHVDGHCPLVRGRDLNAYAACGIRNCHESTPLDEAREKLTQGPAGPAPRRQRVQGRGRPRPAPHRTHVAVRRVLHRRPQPPRHRRGGARRPPDPDGDRGGGAPVLDAYRAASWSAARGFGLRDRGMVAPGYRADLVLLDDLETCARRAR